MFTRSFRSFALGLTGALSMAAMSGQAQAGFSFTAVEGGLPAFTQYETFNGLTLGSSSQVIPGVMKIDFTGTAAAVQGSAITYAPPFLSGGQGLPFDNQPDGPDATTYLTAGVDSVTMTFDDALLGFGLLWGSVDNYNTLRFYDAADNLVYTLTGSDVLDPANGNQGITGTVYVNVFSTDVGFTKVVATSTSYAFEFDNVSYNAVPEPSSIALSLGLAGGLAVAAKRARRRRETVNA